MSIVKYFLGLECQRCLLVISFTIHRGIKHLKNTMIKNSPSRAHIVVFATFLIRDLPPVVQILSIAFQTLLKTTTAKTLFS